MNRKISGIFWGIVLIASGVIALAQTQGYFKMENPTIWISVFAGISILALILFFVSGIRNWGMLFPMGIFGALAITLALLHRQPASPAVAAPIFIGIGFPFFVAYFIDKEENWWALIPATLMVFFALMMLTVDRFGGIWIGAGLFFLMALAFFIVYLKRRAWWAALVAYVMMVLGFVPLMAMTSRPELAGIILFFAIGLPFLFGYLRYPEYWWAVIPAGILLTMGLVTSFVLLPGIPSSSYDQRIPAAMIFVGASVTFVVVWLRHQKRWGLFLAILSALSAIAVVLFQNPNYYWGVFVVAVGIYIFYNALRPKPD